MKLRKTNHRKSNTSTEVYVKNLKGKKYGERERFHYDNSDYNGVSRSARISGINSSSPCTLEGIYFYTSSVRWIKLQSPSLFKHLTAYLKGG